MDGFASTQASKNSPARQMGPLDSMSSVEIAEALEQALDSMTEETYDPALIDAYLNALDQRAPMPPPPDAKASFQALQRKLQGISLDGSTAPGNRSGGASPAKRHPIRRMVVTLAAAMALLFALMIGAQAAGMDIFGSLARWTDEHFLFTLSSSEDMQNRENRDLFQRALAECNLPTELAPTWYPEGFTPKDPEVWMDESGVAINVLFCSEERNDFAINIDKYYQIEKQAFPFEKDTDPVEAYTSHSRTFYIMSNVNSITAAWAGDDLTVNISGALSVDEVKKMINSMGG